MKLLLGRIVRGLLRRLIVEVKSAIEAAENEEEKAQDDPIVHALTTRLFAHPDVEFYTLFQNEWGGYTVQFTFRNSELMAHGSEMEEALSKAIAHVWGEDA